MHNFNNNQRKTKKLVFNIKKIVNLKTIKNIFINPIIRNIEEKVMNEFSLLNEIWQKVKEDYASNKHQYTIEDLITTTNYRETIPKDDSIPDYEIKKERVITDYIDYNYQQENMNVYANTNRKQEDLTFSSEYDFNVDLYYNNIPIFNDEVLIQNLKEINYSNKFKDEEEKENNTDNININNRIVDDNYYQMSFQDNYCSSNLNSLNDKENSESNVLLRKRTKRNKYNMVSTEIKKTCIELMKKMDIKQVSKIMNVSEKSLKYWENKGAERRKGAGRKNMYPELEGKLIDWYNKMSKANFPVTPKMIKEKAKKLSSYTEFKASATWFINFKRKYNLTYKTLSNN
jgi:hypothetical protein